MRSFIRIVFAVTVFAAVLGSTWLGGRSFAWDDDFYPGQSCDPATPPSCEHCEYTDHNYWCDNNIYQTNYVVGSCNYMKPGDGCWQTQWDCGDKRQCGGANNLGPCGIVIVCR